jgi:uncharacterized small protein (DUF1192 family)
MRQRLEHEITHNNLFGVSELCDQITRMLSEIAWKLQASLEGRKEYRSTSGAHLYVG